MAKQIEIKSESSGVVWKITAAEGSEVAADEPVIILESMKMEIPVSAPEAGKVISLLVKEEDMVEEDQTIAILEVAG